MLRVATQNINPRLILIKLTLSNDNKISKDFK